jgi:hypothetical protein
MARRISKITMSEPGVDYLVEYFKRKPEILQEVIVLLRKDKINKLKSIIKSK